MAVDYIYTKHRVSYASKMAMLHCSSMAVPRLLIRFVLISSSRRATGRSCDLKVRFTRRNP